MNSQETSIGWVDEVRNDWFAPMKMDEDSTDLDELNAFPNKMDRAYSLAPIHNLTPPVRTT